MSSSAAHNLCRKCPVLSRVWSQRKALVLENPTRCLYSSSDFSLVAIFELKWRNSRADVEHRPAYLELFRTGFKLCRVAWRLGAPPPPAEILIEMIAEKSYMTLAFLVDTFGMECPMPNSDDLEDQFTKLTEVVDYSEEQVEIFGNGKKDTPLPPN